MNVIILRNKQLTMITFFSSVNMDFEPIRFDNFNSQKGEMWRSFEIIKKNLTSNLVTSTSGNFFKF